MNLHDTFQRLDPAEYDQAVTWYDRLRDPEKNRVRETLDTLLGYRPHPGDKEYKFALIVAGSSIDTDSYGDIDLFILTEESLDEYDFFGRGNPIMVLRSQLYDKLPEYTYLVKYKETDLRDEPSEAKLLEQGLGARVTVSLLYELEGFEHPREDHPDDVILPERPMRAEELIAYNRGRGSKFVVLSRQYDPLSE